MDNSHINHRREEHCQLHCCQLSRQIVKATLYTVTDHRRKAVQQKPLQVSTTEETIVVGGAAIKQQTAASPSSVVRTWKDRALETDWRTGPGKRRTQATFEMQEKL